MKLENLEKAATIQKKLKNIDREIEIVEKDETLFSTVAIIATYNPDRVKELQEEAKLLLLTERSLLFGQAEALD
jgi:hypothetical protein